MQNRFLSACLSSFRPAAANLALSAFFCVAPANGRGSLEINVAKQGAAIPPNFAGLMTEEINYAYDGGLYAELIRNRTFQDPGKGEGGMPAHWTTVGSGKVSLDDQYPVSRALPLSLKIEMGEGENGVANRGYWGIPVKASTTYAVTFYARASDDFKAPITASLRSEAGDTVYAKGDSQPLTAKWQKFTMTLTTSGDVQPTAKARFVLTGRGPGKVWLSFVSVFPPTYQNVPGGLRPDIMELLAGLGPKFIRLPGGNYLEGNRFSDRFTWKQMIGRPEERPGHMGCWSYRSSDGMGMPEYMLWCRQLNADPVLAVFAGYVLNGDHALPGSPEMSLYTQEALEEIEYFTGGPDTIWGKRRMQDGVTEPMKVSFVEIGNEDWFDRSGSYDGRFTEMAAAIRQKYPQIKLIATAPVTSAKVDVYDDHFYRSARELMRMTGLYDPPPAAAAPAPANGTAAPAMTYEGGGWSGRFVDGTRTFVGEWATQEGSPTPTLNAALADAAFVMGMEKNADAVIMECYAPLFTNVNVEDKSRGEPRGWQWGTNLIGYDAMSSFGSPSYYAQAMLSQNRGDVVLPAKLDMGSAAPVTAATQNGFGLGAWHSTVEYTDFSVTTADGKELAGSGGTWNHTGGDWEIAGGTIKPLRTDAETWTVMPDKAAGDRMIHLRARKTAGDEGFLVLFQAADGENYKWWNIGGWKNTETGFEVGEQGARQRIGKTSTFKVESGRWYDLKLEIKGSRYRGYIDGKLVSDATFSGQPAGPAMTATATYSQSDHTVIVKVVNAGAAAEELNIALLGGDAAAGTAIVMQGGPRDVNTVREPKKIAPKTEPLTGVGPSFKHTFPPYSLTILRLGAAGK